MEETIKINKQDIRPIYYQIYEQLREKILSGEVSALSRLPSEMLLAKTHMVSPMTVRQAYTELVNEGLAHRQHGKGTFVAGKTIKNVGVVCLNFYMATGFFSPILRGIEEVINRERMNAHLLSTQGKGIGEEQNALIKNLIFTHQIDGLLLSGALFEKDIAILQEDGVPFVLVHHDYRKGQVPCVFLNDCRAAFLITDFLIKRGHKSIGLISGPLSPPDSKIVRTADKLIAGYKKALKENKVKYLPEYIEKSDYDTESGKKAMQNLLDLKERPSAVFVNGDILAKGAVKEILKKGLRVPDEIEVVNYADSAGSVYPVVRKPLFEMGKAAAEMLVFLMKGKKLKNSRMKIDAVFTPELLTEV
jgi:DNA-binding LacI/PurR family transcriptional regulator